MGSEECWMGSGECCLGWQYALSHLVPLSGHPIGIRRGERGGMVQVGGVVLAGATSSRLTSGKETCSVKGYI
jgi:hypothetical protein